MIQEVQFLCALDFMKSGLMMTRHCIAIYTLVREYFTILESYHHCSNVTVTLHLNACEVNSRIIPIPIPHRTYYKVNPALCQPTRIGGD